MPFRPAWRAERLLLAIDLIGTALFDAEGASTAIAAHLDLLGILVLAFVTSLGGGIVRGWIDAGTYSAVFLLFAVTQIPLAELHLPRFRGSAGFAFLSNARALPPYF